MFYHKIEHLDDGIDYSQEIITYEKVTRWYKGYENGKEK